MFLSFEVDMSVKVGFFLITLLVGSNAFPVQEKDLSIFFDHTDTSGRIVGGTVAGRAPYMVALVVSETIKSVLCGSSLITKRHVLSAAHCIQYATNDMGTNGTLLPSLRGVVGTNNWKTGGTSYEFTSHIIHSGYRLDTVKNDIGILITSTDVVLTDRVALVALNYDFIGGGVATTLSGWGFTENPGVVSPVLMQINLSTLDGSYCVDVIARKMAELDLPVTVHVDPSIEICTFHSIGHGTCYGDTGGPLVLADRNEQIGIASWGLLCANGAPDVSVRISAFRSWIEQNVQ